MTTATQSQLASRSRFALAARPSLTAAALTDLPAGRVTLLAGQGWPPSINKN